MWLLFETVLAMSSKIPKNRQQNELIVVVIRVSFSFPQRMAAINQSCAKKTSLRFDRAFYD